MMNTSDKNILLSKIQKETEINNLILDIDNMVRDMEEGKVDEERRVKAEAIFSTLENKETNAEHKWLIKELKRSFLKLLTEQSKIILISQIMGKEIYGEEKDT